jgi:hypothetical protein
MHKLVVCLLASALMAAAQENGKQFQPKELDAYNTVVKALGSDHFADAITALDAWQQKYPDSAWKDERQALFVQSYAGVNQPAKALDAAVPLLSRDLKSVFSGTTGAPVILRVLYSAAWAIPRLPNPTADELAAAEKAAMELMGWDQPMPGVSDAKWAEARRDMKDKAGAALLYVAMLPGIRAMAKQPPDCATADASYTKALSSYPDKSILSYELGRALTCEAKGAPEKASSAIYEFVRAAQLDPTLGGVRSDPKQVQDYANNVYIKFHGSDEGLGQLRQLTARSPLPPPGFVIKSVAQIADEKRNAFDAANPQLALWMKIRTALLQPDGAQYFEMNLKGTAVPQLTGKLVEARPACRPRELMIAVPAPDSPDPTNAEIMLKLDKPLTGKPEAGQEIRWEGVPSAFTSNPFLLTMETESTKIENLKVTPCTVAPVKRKP